MLKRAGLGHHPEGVCGGKLGDCAIHCPCCPRPGVNLPEDWEKASKEDRFLYIIFLALDACFRLKRGLVSSELKDPGLSTGLSTMGVGMVVCARHEFIQPNGVGDLQKGERCAAKHLIYANMDYIFASVLCHHNPLLPKLVSYDIVCQWWKELMERLRELPPLVQCFIILPMIAFVIPKLHIHGHTLMCNILYSLNLVPGSGQTDGEGIEHTWANIGGIASSTQIMGPGA
ncbi:hypothetical protein B0H13DRAFT_2239358 [Mycena leptocephala]|nr:hypothetical protein B0H13DRAFT_2239358 [Mycena leptocephala]